MEKKPLLCCFHNVKLSTSPEKGLRFLGFQLLETCFTAEMDNRLCSDGRRPLDPCENPNLQCITHKEEAKSRSERLFGDFGHSLDSDSRTNTCFCSKRKAQGDDSMLCSMGGPPALKKMAVSVNMIPPSGIPRVSFGSHVLRLIEETPGKSSSDARSSSLEVGLSVWYSMHCGSFVECILQVAVEVFIQSLMLNFILYSSAVLSSYSTLVSMATTSSNATVQRFTDCDAVIFEGKEEEVDKDKEALDRMGDEKESKPGDTSSTKEGKGEAWKEEREDEDEDGQEIGEERDGEDGGEEGKDDEEQEQEGEEMEEGDEQEEEKEEDDTEVNSALCTLSIPPAEQSSEHGAPSDCRSQQSDDMYHGQEGISSRQVGAQFSHLTDPHPTLSPSRSLNIDRRADADVDTSAICHFPMSAGSASHCMQHERPCLQATSGVLSGQSFPDVSQDMYPEGLHSSMQQMSSQGSPCMHPVANVAGRQTSSDVSKDMYADGSVSHNWQPTPQASPHLQPIAFGRACQTSSDASKDCISPRKCAEPGMELRAKVSKDEITNAELVSNVEDGSAEEVLSSLKDVKATTAKGLLATGLLDGCRVYYHYKGSGSMLTGVIQDGGILCDCRACKGKVVVNVSSFEKHAGSNARHPSDFIFLENGKSLQEYIKSGSQSSQTKVTRSKVTGVVRKATSEEIISERGSFLRSSSARSASAHLKRVPLSTSGSSKPDPIAPRSSQKLQPSQTRDGSRHKLLFQPGGLPDGTEVAYYVKGQRFLTGRKEGHGICCSCCNEVISCSQFEAHAGWASRRNAYISMYLSNGQSLHEFALALSARDQDSTKNSTKENDDLCAECGDGGDLVLCDACPRAYHAECVGLASIPEGDWRCPICEVQRQQPWRQDARDNGRVFGLSYQEKDAQRCQRVVKASGNTIGGCVFCKNGDFLKSGFGPKTIMLCDQCEREFHVGCMKERGVADLQDLPEGEWFCCVDCNHIHDVLEGLVRSGPKLPHSQNFGSSFGTQRQEMIREVSWQLLHGRRGNPLNGRILSEAASIFTESFDPIVDATSGRDLISLMVHSRNTRDQDFQGMYCAVLKRREEVVSAAVLRIFGRQFAEMPLVATASACRGQGYFQMLMSCIEGLLRTLQVKYLILPAAEGAEGIWTNKFGFSKLHEEQLQQFGSQVQIMTFQGSLMLFKVIV